MSDLTEETRDALEMIGGGYHDQPSAEIEPATTTIQRRAGKLQEVDRPAFVKLSTAFKGELATLSGDALKVWIFVALSINRRSEEAHPSLRTIAASVGLAVNTVQKALAELENSGLLAVERGKKRYNIYQIPEYVSANHADLNVSNRDTDGETVSNDGETVSNSAQTVSSSVILNQRNQRNQIHTRGKKITIPAGASEDWMMAAGVDSKEIARLAEQERRRLLVAELWERSMGYGSLPWGTDRKLQNLMRDLINKPADEIRIFARWSRRPFSTFDPAKARMNPERIMELWPLALQETEPETPVFD